MHLQDELGLKRPFRDLRHETVLNVVRTATLLSARGGQVFRKFGLTEAQFNVLFALKFVGDGITQAELGKRLIVTRASITSVLDKLEKKGLVQRVDVPGNRRVNHVSLTEAGLELVARVEPAYIGEIHRILAEFDEDDCHQLIGLMEAARDRLHALSNGNGSSNHHPTETAREHAAS